MMDQEELGQLKAEAWRTLVAVDHVDAKAEDEGLYIRPEWRAWRSQVRAVIRGESDTIPPEPERYGVCPNSYQAHWNKVTSGTLGDAASAPIFGEIDKAELAVLVRSILSEMKPAEPETDPSIPPPEVLAEAGPDEDHAALKARLLGEFSSLRNMLVGHIPMTQDQLARLVALEHPKFQTWLQG